MITRTLTQNKYEYLCASLAQKAYAQPLDASYTVNMFVNGVEYALKLQPERHRRIAVLQALRVYREESNPEFVLITQGNLLSALLELLIYQGVGR